MKRMGNVKGLKRILCLLFLAGILAAGAGFMPAMASAEEDDHGVHLDQVHTIYWRATLNKTVKRGKKVLAKSGTKVIVTKRGYGRSKKSTIVYKTGKEKKKISVPNSWLSFKSDITSISKEGDYNLETKEAFINRKTKVKKKEKYVVWVSLDKQRVNIFKAESKGKNKTWKLSCVYKCSTGNVHTPTKAGWWKVGFKRKTFSGLLWFTEVVGGGMHKWPGPINKKQYGKRTASRGCIRLSKKDAHAVYKKIKVGTRVLVY